MLFWATPRWILETALGWFQHGGRCYLYALPPVSPAGRSREIVRGFSRSARTEWGTRAPLASGLGLSQKWRFLRQLYLPTKKQIMVYINLYVSICDTERADTKIEPSALCLCPRANLASFREIPIPKNEVVEMCSGIENSEKCDSRPSADTKTASRT